MKKKAFIIFVIITIPLGYLVYLNSYVKYKPLVFDFDDYKELIIADKKSFQNNLIKVLNYYDEDYKISVDGQIFVKRKIQADKESISNYTKKALDKNWFMNKTKTSIDND